VPAVVARQVNGRPGSVQLFVENARDAMAAKHSTWRQSGDLGFLWWVGEQGDPRDDNWMVHKGKNDFSVDHEKLFGFWQELGKVPRIPRYEVYRRLKVLTKSEFERGMAGLVPTDTLWNRCQEALRLIDAEIARHGIERVFALPSWTSEPAPSAAGGGKAPSLLPLLPLNSEVFLPENQIAKVVAQRGGFNWTYSPQAGLFAYPSDRLGVDVDRIGDIADSISRRR